MTRRSRLRRAGRVAAGGIVGGAFVLARRHRQRVPQAPPAGRGSDPLEAFMDAPCYREAPTSKSS
jgi:hypothetical protein